MKSQSALFIGIAGVCLLLAGCQESASRSSDRRAQLVGHENIQLKKQIEARDKEIRRLEDEILKMQDQARQESEKQGDTYTKLMEIIADLNKQIEECKAGQSYPAQP
jgi:predicted RNase H-like nuclease (RuvC/YqgF family)